MALNQDSWHEERLLIDGELVAAEGGATYDNINPANEGVIGVAADASPDDVRRAIAAARRAFDETEWSRDVDLRVRCLRQLHEALLEHKDDLADYGLSGGVSSADRDRALHVARRIRTGTMSINGGLWYGADVPFGGYKQSGIGREMGVAGFEEYLETKAMAEPAPRRAT